MAGQSIEATIGALFGVECKRLLFSSHAIRRMRLRQIGYHDVLEMIAHGETIRQ
jgi:hypothetical protein